ncbi:MAG: sodium-dependent transporter [Lysobacterales bacterium]
MNPAGPSPTSADRFGGRFGGLLALIGVAIGLGNVWRFPYMMGAHGGSAFLLLYLLLVVLFAVPVLTAELALGRALRRGLVSTYRDALGRRTGLVLGGLLATALLVANSYYLLIVAEVGYTAGFGGWYGFGDAARATLNEDIANAGRQYVAALLVLAAAAAVLLLGVRGGIERLSRLAVPLFGVLVLVLVVHVLGLPGITDKLGAFLRPDFSLIGAGDVFAALGQACFSLSVGGTFMVVYGSYLDDSVDLMRTAIWTALGDTSAALIAALFIVPAILHFGLDLAAGPGLVLDTLPRLFGQMAGGRTIGAMFLFAFWLMAFLSALAAFEVCVNALVDVADGRLRRAGAIAVVAGMEAVLILPSALKPALIGTLDLIFGSGMQIAGALVAVLALTVGLGLARARQQLRVAAGTPFRHALLWWLRSIIPLTLAAILGRFLIDRLH